MRRAVPQGQCTELLGSQWRLVCARARMYSHGTNRRALGPTLLTAGLRNVVTGAERRALEDSLQLVRVAPAWQRQRTRGNRRPQPGQVLQTAGTLLRAGPPAYDWGVLASQSTLSRIVSLSPWRPRLRCSGLKCDIRSERWAPGSCMLNLRPRSMRAGRRRCGADHHRGDFGGRDEVGGLIAKALRTASPRAASALTRRADRKEVQVGDGKRWRGQRRAREAGCGSGCHAARGCGTGRRRKVEPFVEG